MLQLLISLISAASGAIAGIVQWHIFTKDPLLEKPFGAHLDDLRLHWRMAIAAMIVVSALLAAVYDGIVVLKTTPSAFLVSWIVVVALQSRRELDETKSSPPRNEG